MNPSFISKYYEHLVSGVLIEALTSCAFNASQKGGTQHCGSSVILIHKDEGTNNPQPY